MVESIAFLAATAQPASGVYLPIRAEVAFTLLTGIIIGAFKWLSDQTYRAWERRFASLEVEMRQLPNEFISVKEFATYDRRLENLSNTFVDIQKDILQLKRELANEYVRRDDFIRFCTSLESKLDAVNNKLDTRFSTLYGRGKPEPQ